MISITNSKLMGKNIHFLRRKLRISQKKLAEKTGIPILHLKCIEYGTTYDITYDISVEALKKVCELFDVSVEQLIDTDMRSR